MLQRAQRTLHVLMYDATCTPNVGFHLTLVSPLSIAVALKRSFRTTERFMVMSISCKSLESRQTGEKRFVPPDWMIKVDLFTMTDQIRYC